MTSLEHVSVKHALDRLPSWTGSVDVDRYESGNRGGDEVRGEPEAEVEEVGVGVAVTTSDDEGQELVGVAVEPQGSLRAEDESRGENGDGNGNEVEDEDEGGRREHGGTSGSATGSRSGVEPGPGPGSGSALGLESVSVSGASRRSPRGASPLGSPSRSRSPSDSNSRSQSQSRSSMRGPLEMGESSAATSWTQADAEGVGTGGRPSRDGDSDGRCRSSAERLELEVEVVDVETGEARAPRDRTQVGSPTHMRTGTEGRDVSRKEEVLVMQEEDIGEGWDPSRHNGKARSQDDGEGEGENGEVEVDVDVGSAHALESEHGGDQSLEMNEKDRWRTFGSSGSRRNPRHLRLEFKASSPQPWDEIDPPMDNNETYTSDYYSTLNSKKFGTLQKNRRRPLIPHSTYYFGPPPPDSAYGTPPAGQIDVHHPREIVRIERDYAGGELAQFSPVFPLELEGRITPTQFHQTINDINEILISAHSIRRAFVDNFLAVVTLQLSTLIMASHYTKEMRRLKKKMEELNTQLYNPVGLNILWPQKVAFLFLEIEYY